MTAARSTVACSSCSGRGVVPHLKRKVEDGKPDPFDLQTEELCSKCGGSGKMLASGPSDAGF